MEKHKAQKFLRKLQHLSICLKMLNNSTPNQQPNNTMSKPVATSLRAFAEGETKNDGVTKATTFRVDPKLVNLEPGFNLRAEGEELDAHIERLYLSMKAGAFIPPVDVQIIKGKIFARDGHCRQRAAIRLRKEMPEYTLECRQLRGNEADAVLHMLGTGSGSKPLTPLEQGRGYLRLIKMGMTPVAIAEKLGISRVTVDNGIVLAEAPVAVQQAIETGAVSSTTARDAVKQGEDGVKALLDAVAGTKTLETAPPTNAEPKKTTPKKPAKAKKVTAKTLKGTAAAKKTPETPSTGSPPITIIAATSIAPSDIQIIVGRITATDVMQFLKDYGGEGEHIVKFRTLLETSLM